MPNPISNRREKVTGTECQGFDEVPSL
jgi:hypothetical protein